MKAKTPPVSHKPQMLWLVVLVCSALDITAYMSNISINTPRNTFCFYSWFSSTYTCTFSTSDFLGRKCLFLLLHNLWRCMKHNNKASTAAVMCSLKSAAIFIQICLVFFRFQLKFTFREACKDKEGFLPLWGVGVFLVWKNKAWTSKSNLLGLKLIILRPNWLIFHF